MRFEGTDTYVATPDLMLAVNAAVTLERPLLVKGEPGNGKTMLAKDLPGSFPRRCCFHYVRFTDKETMTPIVDVHFPGLKKALLKEALEVFFELREVPGLKKKPSTSELLDWLKLLLAEDIPPEALRSTDKKVVIPPLYGALLKNEQDVHLFERVAFMARSGR